MEETDRQAADQEYKEIKCQTRRIISAEERIKIIMEGMRGDESIATVSHKSGIHASNHF